MLYTIKSDQLTIQVKSLGGELTSIQDNSGTEYLWQGDPEYWAGQAPVLFPIVGSIPDGKAKLNDGREVELPRHGLIRKQEFQVIDQQEDAITFSIKADEQTKKVYPFDYEVRIRYQVKENRVSTIYNVINHGSETMPYTIGGHPAFCCPIFEGEAFEDYRIEFPENETAACPMLREDGLIDGDRRKIILDDQKIIDVKHSLFYEDALVFDQLKSRQVQLVHKEKGHGIRVEFQGMDYLGIWSAINDAPFVALEPWAGVASYLDEGDSFEQKRGMQQLQPGEYQTHMFTISVKRDIELKY